MAQPTRDPEPPTAPTPTARRLTRDDLQAVVAIDAALVGRTRNEFFERRLAAALARPEIHAQFGVDGPAGLEGFVLARLLDGEFGSHDTALRLQAIGVSPSAQGHGAGRALMRALEGAARKHGAGALRTTAAWTDHGMLGFLDHHGFSLADSQIIDCAVHVGGLRSHQAPGSDDLDDEIRERDQADVRTLTASDLKAIVRIDRRITGRDRTPYMRRTLDAALGESDIGVSLAAYDDDHIVGFLTARVDLGDAGRVESTAVLDTLDVDPDFRRRGIGHALVSQLFVNLSGLRVDRVETSVSKADLALLGFFYDVGFGASQRLAFVKPVGMASGD